MKLAFVIPAYNEEKLIGTCLESVLAEIKRSGIPADVIVVNNASKDRTGEIARSYAGVRVVDEPKKGLVNARDAGFAASEGYDLIANIDSDTIVPEGWLDVVMTEFSRDQNLVCLSGPYIYYDMAWHNRLMVNMFYGLTYLIYVLNRFILRVGSVVQGGNFVFKRDAWVKAGGYDRSIEFFGEDTDVAVRLSRIGGVKWTFGLKMKTSGRRLEAEGVFKTAATYTLNFFWVTFRGKPATMEYKDVRKD
ncbi:MAG: glycosyltransferase family 2 protein [Devosia sp.]|jgi:glycosyltransferase involved in cell wall biosynthesis|uniref:glycosyltransferase family 2 protein n=1 Tax=unclassified Devosia TaxID=196773 RepID=UPI0019EE6120|nr:MULTISPECIES: glycosyltransferase family 2 protein [unclassified Devosia]MBF0678153.1 glycosyltransferase family 2 protein [Devosia sp.]WEJ31413.1 glycosyltransferase family 2 protein [Devosia sp. SD17-2]